MSVEIVEVGIQGPAGADSTVAGPTGATGATGATGPGVVSDYSVPPFATLISTVSATSGVSGGNLNWAPQTGMSSADYPSWLDVDGGSDPVFLEEGLYQLNLYASAVLAAATNTATLVYSLPSGVGSFRLNMPSAGSTTVNGIHVAMVWVGDEVVSNGYLTKLAAADPIGIHAFLPDNAFPINITSYTFSGTGPRTFTFNLVISKVA